jgi:hypothetical protein
VAEFDVFAAQLLEEAKRFREKAGESSDPVGKSAYLHAALMLSFCALEAHVNSISEEFANADGLSVHERGVLTERDVKLEDGEFRLQGNKRMSRLEDRIELLYVRFSGKPIDPASPWRTQLSGATALRNQLTHAKAVPTVSEAAVQGAVVAIVATLDALYGSVYKRSFPAAGMGLDSRLSF